MLPSGNIKRLHWLNQVDYYRTGTLSPEIAFGGNMFPLGNNPDLKSLFALLVPKQANSFIRAIKPATQGHVLHGHGNQRARFGLKRRPRSFIRTSFAN